MRVTLSVEKINANNFITNVISKYHFDEPKRKQMTDIYNNIKEVAKPYAIYRINQKATGIRAIDDSQASVVAMTLGSGVDELSESYSKKGGLEEAYIIDCIANELLRYMYEDFNREYGRYHRRYIKKYIFTGDEIPLTKNKELLEQIKNKKKPTPIMDLDFENSAEKTSVEAQNTKVNCVDRDEITSNEYGVLTPTKSVIFYALLSDNPNEKCQRICESCNNYSCDTRDSFL